METKTSIKKDFRIELVNNLIERLDQSGFDQETKLDIIDNIRLNFTQLYYYELQDLKLKKGEPIPPEEFIIDSDFEYRLHGQFKGYNKEYKKDENRFQWPDGFAMNPDCAGPLFFSPHPPVPEKDMETVKNLHDKYVNKLHDLYQEYITAVGEYIPDESDI